MARMIPADIDVSTQGQAERRSFCDLQTVLNDNFVVYNFFHVCQTILPLSPTNNPDASQFITLKRYGQSAM